MSLHLLEQVDFSPVDYIEREIQWVLLSNKMAHSFISVYEFAFLNDRFPNRWIRRSGSVAWPNLTPQTVVSHGNVNGISQGVEMLTRIGGLCCIGFINLIGVVAVVWRW
jgi:hypothetical protein